MPRFCFFPPARRTSALLLLGLLSLVVAPPGYAQPGELSSFPFLRMAPSARTAALSNAATALTGRDVNALFYNPALLDAAAHRVVSISYLNHLSSGNAGMLAGSYTLDGVATLGVGLRFLSWGSFTAANEFGERTGTFSAGDVALTLGASRALGPRWRYGGSLHLVYSAIATARATAVAVDVGVRYVVPAQRLTLGATVNRLGTALDSFGPSRDRLPFDVRIGLSKRLRYLPLLITLTGYNLHELGDPALAGTTLDRLFAHLLLGGELSLGDVLRLRAGYNHRRARELSRGRGFDGAGLSAGFGLVLAPLRIGYAYNAWGGAGSLHWLTLHARI